MEIPELGGMFRVSMSLSLPQDRLAALPMLRGGPDELVALTLSPEKARRASSIPAPPPPLSPLSPRHPPSSEPAPPRPNTGTVALEGAPGRGDTTSASHIARTVAAVRPTRRERAHVRDTSLVVWNVSRGVATHRERIRALARDADALVLSEVDATRAQIERTLPGFKVTVGAPDAHGRSRVAVCVRESLSRLEPPLELPSNRALVCDTISNRVVVAGIYLAPGTAASEIEMLLAPLRDVVRNASDVGMAVAVAGDFNVELRVSSAERKGALRSIARATAAPARAVAALATELGLAPIGSGAPTYRHVRRQVLVAESEIDLVLVRPAPGNLQPRNIRRFCKYSIEPIGDAGHAVVRVVVDGRIAGRNAAVRAATTLDPWLRAAVPHAPRPCPGTTPVVTTAPSAHVPTGPGWVRLEQRGFVFLDAPGSYWASFGRALTGALERDTHEYERMSRGAQGAETARAAVYGLARAFDDSVRRAARASYILVDQPPKRFVRERIRRLRADLARGRGSEDARRRAASEIDELNVALARAECRETLEAPRDSNGSSDLGARGTVRVADEALRPELWEPRFRSDPPFDAARDGDVIAARVNDFASFVRTHIERRLAGRGELPDLVIDETSVRAALHRMPGRRACGLDGIPVELLRNPECLETVVPALTRILKAVVESRCLPWSEMRTVPVPKPGGRGIRPISIPGVVHKTLDTLLLSYLETHFERLGGLAPNQHGFVRGRSALGALMRLLDRIALAEANGGVFYFVLGDLDNAYNRAVRQTLHDVLRLCWALPPRALAAVEIAGALECALFESQEHTGWARPVRMECGLGQGRPSSPQLFAAYVDEVLAYLEHVGGPDDLEEVFADDFGLGSGDPTRLQALLDAADAAMRVLQVPFAPAKFRYVIFGRADAAVRAAQEWRPSFRGALLAPCERVTYLGVDLAALARDGDHVAPHRLRILAMLARATDTVERGLGLGAFRSVEEALAEWRATASAVEYAAPIWTSVSPAPALATTMSALAALWERLHLRLVGVSDFAELERLCETARLSARAGEHRASACEVLHQLAYDTGLLHPVRRLRMLTAYYVLDHGLVRVDAPPMGTLPHRVAATGLTATAMVRFAGDLASPQTVNPVLAENATRAAQAVKVGESDAFASLPIAERRKKVLHAAVRALAWKPVLEATGSTMRGRGPALRSHSLGVATQRRLLRIRSGVTHAAFLRLATRDALGCTCGQHSGASSLEALLHILQCPERLDGGRRGETAALIAAIAQALPPAAVHAVFERFRRSDAHAAEMLSLGAASRELLHGSLFEQFGRVVDRWFKLVYGEACEV